MTYHLYIDLGWHWTWIPLALLLIASPLIIVAKLRWRYAAILVCLLIGGISFLSYGDLHAYDYVGLSWIHDDSSANRSSTIILTSGGGGLGMSYSKIIDQNPYRERKPWYHELITPPGGKPGGLLGRKPDGIYFFCHRNIAVHPNDRTLYPTYRDPLFRRWGLSVTFQGEAEKADDFSEIHFWAISVPNWFVIMVLFLVLAGVWYCARISRRRRRIHDGVCVCCAYDLRAHKSGENCPECGTPKVKPMTLSPRKSAAQSPPA